ARFLEQSLPVHLDAFDYLRMIFKKMGVTEQYTEISRLLASASCTGLLFPNVALNTTLSRCLQEKNESCGLNLLSFKTCLNLPLLSCSLIKDTAVEKASIYQYFYLGYLLEKK